MFCFFYTKPSLWMKQCTTRISGFSSSMSFNHPFYYSVLRESSAAQDFTFGICILFTSNKELLFLMQLTRSIETLCILKPYVTKFENR